MLYVSLSVGYIDNKSLLFRTQVYLNIIIKIATITLRITKCMVILLNAQLANNTKNDREIKPTWAI